MQYRYDKEKNPVSMLAFGCMRFTKENGKINLEKAEAEILEAMKLGVNYFDTAYIYSGSEEAMGKIFEKNHCREQIYIADKLPHYLIKSAAGLEKTFQEQLRRLRTTYIDFYLMHMLTNLETWEKLKELNDYSINLYIHDFFTNEKLPFNRIYDFKELDSKLLKALIIILDEADISIRGDVLGEIYNFCKSDDNRKIYGEHYTPYNVVKLLLNALDIKEDDILLDPCAGTGRMLTVAKKTLPFRNITFIGQEKNPIAWTLAQMSAFLYNMDLKIGNSPQDALQEILGISVEHVLMNPPFNQSYAQDLEINSQIWDETTCRRSNLNFAWLQLALHYIKENGDAAVILPQTSLSMQRKEDVIARQMLVEYRRNYLFTSRDFSVNKD